MENVGKDKSNLLSVDYEANETDRTHKASIQLLDHRQTLYSSYASVFPVFYWRVKAYSICKTLARFSAPHNF